jgi:hypothetical protein
MNPLLRNICHLAVREYDRRKRRSPDIPSTPAAPHSLPMRTILALSAFFFMLSVPAAHAGDTVPSYVDLPDAPTIAVDWSKGSPQFVTLGGKRTLTFSNGQKGRRYMLVLRQDSKGSRTVIWPSSVHWPGTYGPTLTTTAGKADYIEFIYNGVSYDMVTITQGL